MTSHWVPTLLALQRDRLNAGLEQFQWGLTVTGMGVIAGLVVLLRKARDEDSEGSQMLQRVTGVLVTALGIGIIAYGWLGFSKL